MSTRLARRGSLLLLAAAVAFAGRAGTATIEVADGVVEVAQDDLCSLIEALENANGDATHADCTAGEDGPDTVVLAADSVYTLTDAHNVANYPGGSNGLPSITSSVVVWGRGATVERSSESDTPEFRLFHVNYPSGDLTLKELTLRNGRTSFRGGGIANVGTLTLVGAAVSGNSSTSYGGGVFTIGVATISHSTLSGNYGGGIVNWAVLNISHSTVSSNSGSGIESSDGLLTVSHSTVSSNSGSGVECTYSNVTLVNSTSSGNSGDGIHAEGCGLKLFNSTISGNFGRGVHHAVFDSSGPLRLTNTIIANSEGSDCEFEPEGFGPALVFTGANLIEDGSCGCSGPACISGDPLLGELADNGGPSHTHALIAGSIAIDKADSMLCPEDDQRGVLRGIDGIGDGSDEDLDGGCDIGAYETGGSSPIALLVDPQALISDSNGVFEPGERVIVAPAWQNASAAAASLTGTASDFTGPAGPRHELVGEDAEYGDIEPAEVASCQETGICYEMEVGLAGGNRPATHWEATFEETLSDATGKTWTLHIGDSFADVSRTHAFYRFIESLLHHGVTGGCSGSEYCPAGSVTRAAVAVFVLKAHEGRGYAPPGCVEGDEAFVDVPFDSPFCPWIEELASRGVTAGCGGGNYCPAVPVTRAQMAVFLLRTLLGAGYEPPACAGLFEDVLCPSPYADWIEDLHKRGITSGCGTDPLEYCPASSSTRGQMSVFLSKTFSLTLYGP